MIWNGLQTTKKQRKMPNPENLVPIPKGVSLNPNGRPKGSRSMKVILREMMELVIDTPKNEIAEQWESKSSPAVKGKMTIKDALVLKDISNAMKGNDKAAQRIWEYLEGKPDQHQVLEVKQPQTKSEMVSQLKQYADRSGLTLQEYCEREGVDIATIPDDLESIEGENAPAS